jgi:serine/threonine protein kinase
MQDNSDLKAMEKDITNLAFSLSEVDPTNFGLLACLGVVKKTWSPDPEHLQGQFELIFRIPSHLQSIPPCSLRSALLSCETKSYALADRVRLAASLARSVVFIHSLHFVHKRISPENVLLFSTPGELGSPFLVGFEHFRPVESMSRMIGDSRWEKNLYQHPTRQGQFPEERFNIKHDIYSVGVCLLEIGLWDSFVQFSGGHRPAVPSKVLPISELIGHPDRQQASKKMKAILIAQASSLLPQMMGQIYSDAVVACLTCLDSGNKILGDDDDNVGDEDQVTLGVKYIEKVSKLFHLKFINQNG